MRCAAGLLPDYSRQAEHYDDTRSCVSAHPRRVLEAGEVGATSYFERMQRDHRDELRAGLVRLRQDIELGRAPRRAGTATVLCWRKD